jgi:DNA-binding MarR family transcriptional regulator
MRVRIPREISDARLDNVCFNEYIYGMSGRLQHEVGKVRPFDSLEQEVYLNIQRTADALRAGTDELLKPFGLSGAQYNVLRILRGAGSEAPMSCSQVGQRMITREPDMTRLLDRLEARGLISRCRDTSDRRVVATRITAEGLRILSELDEPILQLHRRQLEHLAPQRLRELSELLELARGA